MNIFMATTIEGISSNDFLPDTSGDDLIYRHDGNDAVSVIAGRDHVAGGTGNDRINDGAWNDWLISNADNDVPDGTTGSDTAESTSGRRDTIVDFGVGGAVISLSTIDAKTGVAGDQVFSFIGTVAFSGVADQLRFSTDETDGYVMGDVVGNGTADLEIRLLGVTAMTAAEFIL